MAKPAISDGSGALAHDAELHELAEAQAGSPDRIVEEFVVKLRDNPHLSAKAKADMVATHQSDANRITRIEGDFLHTTQRIFGEYALRIHGVEVDAVPHDWTRYAVVDPGHQICAVLFAAVPPPELWPEYGELVLYDELYLPKCDAAMFGQIGRAHV